MREAIAKLQARFGHKSEDIYIWIDYSSIPQKNRSSQTAAIDTIANYAALSKYFVVTAPAATHADTGLSCNVSTYLSRGWCRLEQWAAMASSTAFDHMYLCDGGDLHSISERQALMAQSVDVFEAEFTCPSDKERLVNVVLALFSFCIACGKHQHGPTKEILDLNRQRIFPPELFGDSVEVLEMELQKTLEGRPSAVFSATDFHRLLFARQELCRLHGSDLPEPVLDQFSEKIKTAALSTPTRIFKHSVATAANNMFTSLLLSSQRSKSNAHFDEGSKSAGPPASQSGTGGLSGIQVTGV